MLQRKKSVAARLMAAFAVGAWLIVATHVAGCGQKGPLTLAKPEAASSATPAAKPAASAASAS